MQTLIIVKLILLIYMLPFVENLIRSKRVPNGSIFYEPVSAVDIAFDEFPTLTDVLPTLLQKTSSNYDNMPAMPMKNISIDLDRINIKKFRNKIDNIANMMKKDEPTLNASRRQAYINWAQEGSATFYKAADQMMRRKGLDLMLQVLYMARHKIGKLQNAKHFSTKDTGFRIAYTYRTLTRIYRKMMRVYSYQSRNRSYGNPLVHLILHGRVARLHVDFCYLYWVLIKIDGKYRHAKGIRKEKKKLAQLLEEQVQAQNDAQSQIKGGGGDKRVPKD